MSRMTDIAEQLLDKAKNIVANNPDDELPSAFLLIRSCGHAAFIQTPWEDETDKMVYLAMIADLCADEGVEFYLHASEAWEAHGEGPEPRLRPDRREVLVIVGCMRDYSERFMWTAPIVRLESGARLVGVLDRGGDKNLSGRLFELFPKPKLNG